MAIGKRLRTVLKIKILSALAHGTQRGGKVCYQITWHFVKDGQRLTKAQDGKCEVAMVSDKDGQVWHNWSNDSDWWRGFPQDKNFTKGSKYKRQIAKLRKKYGV